MKKVPVLALCLLLVLVLVGGCTSGTEPGAGTEEPGAGTGESGAIDYPTREIEVVYHSTAGSGGDIFLRSMGKAVEPHLGQPWVVNNMPGASGATAWNYVANSEPDGHTILGVSSTIVTAPLINEMPVNYTDFEPVCMMFTDPMVIFVPVNSPFETLADLVEAAQAEPGKYKFAGGTPGELGFVAARELMKAADFQVDLVPFEGGGDAVASVLGGHLDGAVGEYAEVSSAVEAGDIRLLVAFNKMPQLPDIPTIAEEGYPEVQVEKLRGIFAPKGTPEEVIDKLCDIMQMAYDDPEFQKYIEANNMIPNFKAKGDFLEVVEHQHNQIKESLESL